MSTENILEAFRRRLAGSDTGTARPRIGSIASVDRDNGVARVLIQPEGVLTGWLPLLSLWTGNGWGMSCPPSQGDQVLLLFQENDADNGVIIGSLYSNSVLPPQAQVGEFVLRHRSGSSISLLNSGVISIQGDLRVEGDIYDSHGSLSRFRKNYDAHIHHISNGAITSIPSPQD